MIDPAPVNVRELIRDFIRSRIQGRSGFEPGQLASEAEGYFSGDPEFMAAAISLMFDSLVGDELHHMMGELRNRNRRRRKGKTASDQRQEKRAKVMHKLLFESVGPNRRKAILKMVRPDLTYVVAERETQAAGFERFTGFVRDLRNGLPDDRTTVDAYYSEEEYQTIYDRHFAI